MPHAITSIGAAGVVILAVSSCVSKTGADSDAGNTQGRLSRALWQPDLQKRSQFDGKVFQSKAVRTKEFRTGEARVEREFDGGDRAFNVAARQGRDYAAESSRFQEMVSPMAKKTARTSSSRFEGQEARTEVFHGADKVAPTTTTTSAESRRFKKPGSREFPAAARAQEDSIRGSDLVIGQSNGGAPGGTNDDGRLLNLPADLRPDSSSVIGAAAGKSLSIDDVRRILNKGSR
jgi:hypothetical protein